MSDRDPYANPLASTEIETAGEYIGQCRTLFNILQQWDGKEWRRVPAVADRRPQQPVKLHFFPY